MRLIHLTDPHLSSLDGENMTTLRGKRWSGYLSWRKNRRQRYLPEILVKLTAAIRTEGADQILCTGDLVQIGLDSEIAEAADWLKQLGPAEQVMLVPGNHDIYATGSLNSVYEAWSDYLCNGDQPVSEGSNEQFPVLRKRGKLSFIGLSSACVTPVFMATGKLGEEQLNRLDGMLKQAAGEGQLVCLLIHHPPLPGMTKWRKALSEANELQAVLKRYPPLLIFHGHLHHNREQQWGESRIYCTASASSTSDASYRVIDIEEMDDYWALSMALKSVAIEASGELGFATVDEQTWQLAKAID
jgi:3',5'-cyclic AMP phosphodiesterase CpdA